MPPAAEHTVDLDRFRTEQGARVLREFMDLLSLRNVAGEPGHLRANCAWIRSALERRGLHTEVWRDPAIPDAAPAVYASLDIGAPRTVGLYAHYDGQPADGAGWAVGPWTPALFSGRIDRGGVRLEMPEDGTTLDNEWRAYARSAADDKGPIIALLAALDAIQVSGATPSINLRVLIEGEEEITSPSLPGMIASHRDELAACDIWVLCDGPCDTFGRRHVAFGTRGDIELEWTVWGPSHELHSGHFGNFIMNPAMELMRLVGSMKDENGRVTVEGFYDGMETLGGETAGQIERTLRAAAGVGESEGGNTESYFDRLMRHSLNLRGVQAADVRERARNVIPAWARASFDVRTAGGTDPTHLAALMEEHARRMGFRVTAHEPTRDERRSHPRILTAERLESYPGWHTPMDDRAALGVVHAVERTLGIDVLRVPTLGSSMPMHAFGAVLDRPVIALPMANTDNNQHSVNENLRLGHLWDGIAVLVGVLLAGW